MDQWTEITTGGVLALLIIREVLGFLKPRNGNGGNGGNGGTVSIQIKELRRMTEQIQKLYDWHDQRDRDGVPVWYVRESLERHIEQLTAALRDLITDLQKYKKED
jgi:hypothetical protein